MKGGAGSRRVGVRIASDSGGEGLMKGLSVRAGIVGRSPPWACGVVYGLRRECFVRHAMA